MANKTVSNLNELTTVSNSDVLLVETATETLKVTKENLLKEVNEQLKTKSDMNHTHGEYVTESGLSEKGLATEVFVINKISEAQLSGNDVDLSNYQTKEDNALTTTSKTIVEAINEINASVGTVSANECDFMEVTQEGAIQDLLIDIKMKTDGYINQDGMYTKVDGHYGYTDYIRVYEGERIELNSGYPKILAVWFDSNKSVLSAYTDGNVNSNVILTVPTGACYVRTNFQLDKVTPADYKITALDRVNGIEVFTMDNFRLKEKNIPNGIIQSKHLNSSINLSTNSIWKDKKVLFIGDSITDLSTDHVKYCTYLEETKGFIGINNGISGSGYVIGGFQGSDKSLVNRLSTLPSDADLVIVFLGTNDFWNENGAELGTETDGDNTKFWGGVQYCLDELIKKYPLKTIAVMSPLQRRVRSVDSDDVNAKGLYLKDYYEIIKLEAKKRSLPFLDLWENGNFYVWNTTFRATYCNDGLHPTSLFHKNVLARKVGAWMETL